MKTRFDVNTEIFLKIRTLEDGYKRYEDYYKDKGFVLDKINESVYKEFNREIHLNEGERVYLEGFKFVDWKCIDLDKNIIRYSLIDE